MCGDSQCSSCGSAQGTLDPVEIANASLYNADCQDILPTLEDNSVDAIVTDPPAGISFMGKQWDSDKGGRDAWIAWLGWRSCVCLGATKDKPLDRDGSGKCRV
jgi:DNA modification methylase